MIINTPIYIINGKKYTKRLNRTIDLIKSMKFTNFKRWNATFPKNNINCSLKKEILGCSKSHRKLWKHIHENHKDDKWIIIFEDDIQLPSSVKADEMKQVIKKYLSKATHKGADVMYFGYCWYYVCAHAYAVTPKGAKILYDNTYDCRKIMPQPIDVQMSELREKKIIKIYRSREYKKKKTSWAEGLIHQTLNDTIIKSHKI